ncbi:MAG: zinc ribbon domain-containing protein [Anaerofustis sp.]
MKFFDDAVVKIRYKKLFIVYMLIVVLIFLISAAVLCCVFRDKIAFASSYHGISKQLLKDGVGFDSVKTELETISDQTADLVDIIAVNSDNQIIFTSKNSFLAQNQTFELQHSGSKENSYLKDLNNYGIYYKLVAYDEFPYLLHMITEDSNLQQSFNNEHFYESDFTDSTIYSLGYLIDGTSHIRIYFIGDINPIRKGDIYISIIESVSLLLFMGYWVLVAVWVYANAARCRLNKAIWGLLILFTNLFGVIIYTIYKQSNRQCYKCGAVQNKDHAYCICCGTQLTGKCPSCGGKIETHGDYCPNCGITLSDSKESMV